MLQRLSALLLFLLAAPSQAGSSALPADPLSANQAIQSETERSDIATLDQPSDSEELQRALVNFDRAIAMEPTRAALYLERAHLNFRRGDNDAAVADYTTALKFDDRLDDAYFGRGMAHGRNGSLDESIEDLSVYLKRYPKSSLAYTKRGVRRMWAGDFERAEQDLRQALAIDPNNAEAHDDLGVILARAEDYEGAVRHFTATIKADPSYQKGYHNLAMVRFIQGQTDEALALSEQALKLKRQARDTMMLKGLILQSLGRHAEANEVIGEAELLPEGNWSERLSVQ